ncbi:SWIM zinc finger family protein [Metabacillus dongyingensis]|uniref:SWIM zinc finger family protein n=1 Tax=Metabacillus dongyingensis TaxID=2874282 RepID=UPI001CBC41D1|nr:SWIM zinc finger family protein [Metabacillus dongyingensis]UAL52087.1 SWIM zinc finger domain-containing protein [Metabacillus dongyingensis]
MLQHELDKELILHAGEELQDQLSPELEDDRNLVKKGLMLYRQSSVYNVKIDGHTVSANVQDVTPVRVVLELDFFTMSSCSCPADFPCRHVMASFLYLYASVERVGTYMDAWNAKTQQAILAQLKPASQMIPSVSWNDDSLSSWLSFFEFEYKRWAQNRPRSIQQIQSLYNHYYPVLKKKAPKNADLRRFYTIHANLTTLFYMLRLLNETKPNDHLLHHVYHSYFEECIESITYELREMRKFALPFSLDSLFEESIEVFHQLLDVSSYLQFERISLYRALWIGLLNRKKWIEREVDWLNEQLSERDVPEYRLALIHMDFLQGDDDALFEKMKVFNDGAFPILYDWVGDLVSRKNWKRAAKWFTYLLGKSDAFLNSDIPYEEKRRSIRFFLDMLSEYSTQTKDERLYENACRNLLPFSYAEYHHFLVNRKQFRTWAELHLLLGFELYEIDRDLLKMIEKESPESLLTIYHHAIRQEIALRTRTNYKLAVRYLKKVRTLYKKIKNETQFEIYLEKLSHEHRRLRAFQEELKRGKLIHAE